MEKDLEIKEIDLFYYVFSPGELSPEKKEVIRSDERSFNEINFYRDLCESLRKNLNDSLKKKISQRIPEYATVNKIIFRPLGQRILKRK